MRKPGNHNHAEADKAELQRRQLAQHVRARQGQIKLQRGSSVLVKKKKKSCGFYTAFNTVSLVTVAAGFLD